MSAAADMLYDRAAGSAGDRTLDRGVDVSAAGCGMDLSNGSGWCARLQLDFETRGERTVLARRHHSGPMMVQSAFYPEGDPCHVYLLHPPGGLVGGDQLRIKVTLADRTHALLTTPAAGKFYRSRRPGSGGPVSAIRQDFAVGDGAILEWLPCESIVFNGANCDARTHIDLHSSSKLLAWDGWVFGRPACNERFDSGTFTQHFEVHIDQCPVLIERNRLLADSPWMAQPWGLNANPAIATLVAYPGGELALRAARAACVNNDLVMATCTEMDGLVVCRVKAEQLPAVRRQMELWWRALRPIVLGCKPIPPRIWAT